MKETIYYLKAGSIALGGYVGYFLGGFDGFLYALLIFVVADYITGIMVAILERKLSSSIGFKGISKKILIFILVGIGHVLDRNIIGDGSVVRTAIIFFYISNEGISIMENSIKLGLPIPKKLKEVLEQLSEEENEDEQ